MKPIKKGMTEAVTRDGRKVTQLTWFEGVNDYEAIYGVIDGYVYNWSETGAYYSMKDCELDLFAPVEYEWQWLAKRPDGFFDTTGFHRTEESAQEYRPAWKLISRIEESKREVR